MNKYVKFAFNAGHDGLKQGEVLSTYNELLIGKRLFAVGFSRQLVIKVNISFADA